MKIPRQSYNLEFKELAVKRIKDGQSYSSVAKELGINEQTLRNWSSAAARGALTCSRTNPVTEEQMELFRLRAENAKLKRENEIIKRERCTSRKMQCEARLDRSASPAVRFGKRWSDYVGQPFKEDK